MGAYASPTSGGLRVREPPPRPTATSPQVVLLAGPNGAGKSTAAPELLRDSLHVRTFINVTGATAENLCFEWRDVSELDIRRRYRRGLVAFVSDCRTIVATWRAYDAGGARPRLIAFSWRDQATRVVDERAWATLLQQAGAPPDSGGLNDD